MNVFGRRQREAEFVEEQIAVMNRVAAAQEKLQPKNVDVRAQALNLALAHANYVATVEGGSGYLRDFEALMLKAETFLTFLLDDRVQ